jgi:predicted porin
MKQKLLVLALAGLSGGAFAQSNVTISGVVRVGFEQVSAGGATVAGADATSRNRVTDNGSNIRFASEESLGNGLTAWWQMESAIGVSDNQGSAGAPTSTAANVTTLGSRNTAVGVKGAWGNLFMGKWDVHYSSGNGVDTTNGNDAFSSRAQILNITHGNGAVITAVRAAANANNAVAGAGRNAANTFGGRQNNVISYVSPSFSGFDVRVTHSTQSENTSAAMRANDRTWAINPAYSNGPISAFYSYMKLSNTGAVASAAPVAGDTGNNLTGNRLGAAYTFPMGLKIGLVWDKNKAEVADGSNSFDPVGILATGGNVGAHALRERTAWGLPIEYVSGPHRVNFAYAKAGNLKTNVGTVNDSGAKMLVLGYQYSLSKRTSVAALYSTITNGTNAAYDYRETSVNIAGTSGTGLAAGADPRTLQVAMRHAF